MTAWGAAGRTLAHAAAETAFVATRLRVTHRWAPAALTTATTTAVALLGTACALWTGSVVITTASATALAAAITTAAATVTTGALCATATTAAAVSTACALTATLAGLVLTNTLQHFGTGCTGSCLHHIAAWRLARATPNGLAAHSDGFTHFALFGPKTFDDLYRDVLLGKALDVLHEAFFVQAHQVHRSAVVASTASAANAVHIVFANVGDFVVHYVWQVVNVNAAGGNVGGYQRAHIAALEARQGLGPRSLALVAVQGHGRDAVLFQELSHVVGTKFGTGEHQYLAPLVFVDDVGQ